MNYPPFSDIILFGLSSGKKEEVEEASKKLYNIFQRNIKKYNVDIKLFNAVTAPISRIKNKYRWRIIGKCNLNMAVINLINITLNEFYELKKYKNVRIVADINPNNMN